MCRGRPLDSKTRGPVPIPPSERNLQTAIAEPWFKVSDQPMVPEGVKTEASDRVVTANYVERHIQIGIEALKLVRRRGRSVKHLRFEADFEAGHEP